MKKAFTLAEVPEAQQHSNRQSAAFTLAEVLITLAIIGIVTALALPTLLHRVQLRQQNATAENFQMKLTEAIKVMNTQQVLAGHQTTESFVNELGKHYKILKTCSGNDILTCFNDTVLSKESETQIVDIKLNSQNLRTSAGLGQRSWGTNIVGAQFANGVLALIAYNPKCSANAYSNQVTGADCYVMVYDVSGREEPNTLNYDVRYTGNARKLGDYSLCKSFSNEACIGVPFHPTAISAAECENMKLNGLMPNYVECIDDDYWGGAVKMCNGFNNMADYSSIAVVVKKIYGHNTGTWDVTNVNMNADVAASYGFPRGYFAIWRKSSPWKRTRDDGGYDYWGPASIFWQSEFRNGSWGYLRNSSSDTFGICVGDYGD